MTSLKFQYKYQAHPFHLVDTSPWPLYGSLGALSLVSGFAGYMHSYINGKSCFLFGLFFLLFIMFCWWTDVVSEATFAGEHTSYVQLGLRLGMILFIASEVMFFFAFFWGFFHSSLSPQVTIGALWPPKGIETISAYGVPLANTILLVSSGATVTWCHHAIVANNKDEACTGLIATIVLAALFTLLQIAEYLTAPFNISTSVFGSCFFMTTGFHGFHVFVGTCFLAVCLYRLIENHFTKQHHFGFEAAAWYWHFVDVVWLFLFIAVYWWGGN